VNCGAGVAPVVGAAARELSSRSSLWNATKARKMRSAVNTTTSTVTHVLRRDGAPIDAPAPVAIDGGGLQPPRVGGGGDGVVCSVQRAPSQ
jgi:hypothetical protein